MAASTERAARGWMSVLALRRSGCGWRRPGRRARGPRPDYRVLRGRRRSGSSWCARRAGGTGARVQPGRDDGDPLLRRARRRHAWATPTCGGRDRRHAELAAVLDALLQEPTRRASARAPVIEPLVAARQARRQAGRGRAVARPARGVLHDGAGRGLMPCGPGSPIRCSTASGSSAACSTRMAQPGRVDHARRTAVRRLRRSARRDGRDRPGAPRLRDPALARRRGRERPRSVAYLRFHCGVPDRGRPGAARGSRSSPIAAAMPPLAAFDARHRRVARTARPR